MVLRCQPPGAAAMLLIMLFPQDIARRPHSARCRPAVGVPQATSVMAVEGWTSGLWGDLCPCHCSTECRIALVCIVSVQGAWDRREPIPRSIQCPSVGLQDPFLVRKIQFYDGRSGGGWVYSDGSSGGSNSSGKFSSTARARGGYSPRATPRSECFARSCSQSWRGSVGRCLAMAGLQAAYRAGRVALPTSQRTGFVFVSIGRHADREAHRFLALPNTLMKEKPKGTCASHTYA